MKRLRVRESSARVQPSASLIAAAITSQLGKAKLPTHIALAAQGLADMRNVVWDKGTVRYGTLVRHTAAKNLRIFLDLDPVTML